MSEVPTPDKHTAPLTPLQRTFLEIMQRRDLSRRWHIVRKPPSEVVIDWKARRR